MISAHKTPHTQTSFWFYLFVFIHIAAWTCAPTWIRYTLPMDALEGTTWGHQLEWGYDKNPFLNGWLTHLAELVGGQSGWAIYLFSQLSVGLCFWAIWQLSKKILPPIYALVSVLLLEGMQYYNFHAIDFNDNTLELSLWALTALFFYQALQDKKLRDWLLVGCFAGLGVMAKYYTAVLLLPMLLFLFISPVARQQLKSTSPYLGLLLFLTIIAPHFIWLFSHDFITVQYALRRVTEKPSWWNHVANPIEFAWQQFEVLLPALLLLVAFSWKNLKTPAHKNTLSIKPFDYQFLLYVGLGPLIVTLLLSMIGGIKLRAGWGQPLLSFFGILLIIWFTPVFTPKKLFRFIATVFSCLMLMILGYCIALMRAESPSSANFPGKKIATTLTQQWHEQFHKPLAFVAGPRWIAGNVAFYSKDRPTVYINWDKKISFWIDEAALKKSGAIFIWDPSEHSQIPFSDIQARFAHLGKLQTMRFPWQRNKNMPPVEITVAILPPEKIEVSLAK